MLNHHSIIFWVLCVLLNGIAGAHDLLPPAWRGEDGTTFQSFSFDDDSNPTVINNAFGQSIATITVGNPNEGVGWLDTWLGFDDQQGFWSLSSDGQIELVIDNQSTGDQTFVQVQLYSLDIMGAVSSVDVENGQPYEMENWQTVIVDTDDMGLDNLVLQQSVYVVTPASDNIKITVSADAFWGSLIDQIVVDSKTEPGVCIVNLDDLAVFCQEWLQTGPDLRYDLDDSGKVDLDDFSVLARYWQQTCPW